MFSVCNNRPQLVLRTVRPERMLVLKSGVPPCHLACFYRPCSPWQRIVAGIVISGLLTARCPCEYRPSFNLPTARALVFTQHAAMRGFTSLVPTRAPIFKSTSCSVYISPLLWSSLSAN